MSKPQRKLRLVGGKKRGTDSGAQSCPVTGVGIPECSCGRCIEEQIRHHSPALLDRRFPRGSGNHAA